MKTKSVVITAIAVLILSVGFTLWHGGSTSTTVVKETQVGSVTGPEIFSPYISFNGVRHWYYSFPGTSLASTTCVFKLPNASTTLEFASVHYANMASSSVPVEIGYSVSPNTTTTLLSTLTPTGSGDISSFATSTQLQGVFLGGAYINIKAGGAQAHTPGEISRCQLDVVEI